MFVVAGAMIAGIASTSFLSSGWADPVRPSPDSMSDDQLIRELSEPGAIDPDRRTAVATELADRGPQLDRKRLLATLVDESQPGGTRAFMVDLVAGSPQSTKIDPEVRALLKDKRLDSSLKARIVTRFAFDKSDAKLLHELVVENSDILAFHALKGLAEVDRKDALALAWDIAASNSRQTDMQRSAAYKVLVRNGGSVNASDRSKLTEVLQSVLDDPSSSGDLRDAALFGLSEMKTEATLRVIMNSKNVDTGLVGGAIDENASVLLRMLEESPSESTIEFVVSAMEIHPVFEFAEPLSAAASSVKSAKLRQRIETVVRSIPIEGVPLNTKWTQD